MGLHWMPSDDVPTHSMWCAYLCVYGPYQCSMTLLNTTLHNSHLEMQS